MHEISSSCIPKTMDPRAFFRCFQRNPRKNDKKRLLPLQSQERAETRGAGPTDPNPAWTDDGYEMSFGVNHGRAGLKGGLEADEKDGPRHYHSFRGSFSAGSTLIFASKYAFFRIFQTLQENHLLASKFAKFCKNFTEFCKNFEKILEIFRKNAKI